MGHQGTLRLMRTAGGLSHRNALRKKITSVIVKRLVFVDDHEMLTDITPESDNWAAGGARYVDKQGGAHWLADGESYPASITKATQLSIEVELALDSADADPIECVVTATPSLTGGDSDAPEAFTFQARVVLGGKPIERLVLKATRALADQVFLALDWTLIWTIEAAARTFDAGTTGPHRLYVTYGTPDPGGRPLVTPFGADPPPLEDGITEKRMHAAVDLAEKQWRQGIHLLHPETKELMDRNDPHHLAFMLNASVPGYTLTRDPDVPPEYNHPGYYNYVAAKPLDQSAEAAAPAKPGANCGAWAIAQYRESKAECQAIVRFVRGILMQIGCPGEAKLAAVYANAEVDEGATALVDYIIPRDPDPTKYRYILGAERYAISAGTARFVRMGWVGDAVKWQQLNLADQPVTLTQKGAIGTVMNSFEACLEFTHGGEVRYYGGGVSGRVFKTPDEVLHIFWGLVWTSQFDVVQPDPEEAPPPQWQVDEIVRTYE